jgi:hypothetical protein
MAAKPKQNFAMAQTGGDSRLDAALLGLLPLALYVPLLRTEMLIFKALDMRAMLTMLGFLSPRSISAIYERWRPALTAKPF